MRLRQLGLLASVVALAACGKFHESSSSTQVVARVNNREITVHQLNAALKQVGVGTADSKRVVDSVMDRLINQELLVQKASAAKLDQTPGVQQAIESSKRTILASAYLQSVVADTASPSDRDVHEYFVSHPDFFTNRRVYVYRSIVVQGPPADLDAAAKILNSPSDLDAALGYLRSKKLEFLPKTVAKADEEINPQELPRLAALKEGDVLSFRHPDGLEIVKMITSTPEPIDETQGRPFIEKFLKERRREERAADEIKALRAAATVQFVGQYKASAPAPVKQPAAPGTRDDVTKGIAQGIH